MDYSNLYKLSDACLTRYNISILDLISKINNNTIFLIKITETYKTDYPLYMNTIDLILEKLLLTNTPISYVNKNILYFKEWNNDKQNIIAYYMIKNTNLVNLLNYYNIDNTGILNNIINDNNVDNYLNLN